VEIKINDDGTVLIDGVEYVRNYIKEITDICHSDKYIDLSTKEGLERAEKLAKEHSARLENPWFIAGKDDYFCCVDQLSYGDGVFEIDGPYQLTFEGKPTKPRLRPEYADDYTAGDSELKIWQAMGVGIGEEGDVRCFVDWEGDSVATSDLGYKSTRDALFLTREDAEEALKEFGLERLKAARLKRWGK
jgi:hypothetical protein